MYKRIKPKIRSSFTVLFSALVLSIFNINMVNASDRPLFKTEPLKLNHRPSWLNVQDRYFYDADIDDLITAGYGFTKLSNSKFETIFANPNQPTYHELRQAKLNRHIDITRGEGLLFGFNKQKLTPLFDGKVAGTEIQAYLDNGEEKVAFLLQIPLDFDTKKPCIVAIPTMDSEGVFNAKDMQIRGLWGLNHNCAVVYNDKGLGNFLFDMEHKQGYLLNGKSAAQSAVQDELLFSVESSLPVKNRYAVKQLHSKQNPEAKWGQYVINSLEFAFYELNDMFSPTNEVVFDNNNTSVIVYGMSEGAGAALKAGEYDKKGIIDGIIAVNPQIQVSPNHNSLYIQHGQQLKSALKPKLLVDYITYAALYMPCAIGAIKSDDAQSIPYKDRFFYTENRCKALKEEGLLIAENAPEQANEALNKLYQYGWNPHMAMMLPYHYYSQSVNLPYRYISQYGKYGVEENLCDFSVASVDQDVLFNEGMVEPLSKISFSQLWINNSGSLPIYLDNNMTAINLVNNTDPRGPRTEWFATSRNRDYVDYNLAGAICLRNKLSERRTLDGINQVLATADLNQIKTIIVHGQLDTKTLIEHSSRPYVALNSYIQGSASELRYIEVENAANIDGTLPFDNIIVPIDYYGENAANLLWANLMKNASLPDSQVVRTKVRGGNRGQSPAINKYHLPSILQSPKQDNRIILDNGTLILPN